MDNTEALKTLYRIAVKQQEAIKRLAQMHGAPTPAPAPAADDLSAKLQAALFGAHRELESAFVQPPTVSSNRIDSGGKYVVQYKALRDDKNLQHAVSNAATQVLGVGNFSLAGSTTF